MKGRKIFAAMAAAVLLLSLPGCTGQELTNPADASARVDGAEMILEWGASSGAEFYRIYRKERGSADYKFVDDEQTTKYTDSTAKADEYYRYKITAVRGNKETEGCLTGETAILSQNKTDAAQLHAPTVSSVTKMNKFETVIIFCDENSGCQYEIRRSETAGGEYTLIGTTGEPVFYDDTANGETYFYTVTAVQGDNRSQASDPQETGTNAQAVFCVPVMMYHEFVTQEDLDSGVAFDEYVIWKDEFESDLRWLQENGYTTITSAQLIDCLEGKGTMPEKPIILSIDDGRYGVYKNAYPLLKQYGMTASLSLIGYEIDNASNNPDLRASSIAPYCTWKEIAEMAESGVIEMISHTQSLHNYAHDNRTGANCAEGETLESFLLTAQEDYLRFNQNLKKATGLQTETMAYPYSKRSVTSDRAWLKSGYKILFSGNSDEERMTYMNYYVAAAGINSESAVTRRLPRMTLTPIADYLADAIEHDT